MIDAVSAFSARLSPTGVDGVDRVAPLPRSQAPAVEAEEGPSFGQILEQVSREAVDSVRGAEATSISALRGDATTLEVVEAIKAAELALQTATAVRDKVVQAYQEVSRMAI
jgi:flagellar hook-basal body complex protein FliE